MIDNDPILWTMLNAIKEQNAQIEQLRNRTTRKVRKSHDWKQRERDFAQLKRQVERLQARAVLPKGSRTSALAKHVAQPTR